MKVGKVGKKGQIVIPKEIRDKYNIKKGDIIIFKIYKDKIMLEKIEEKLKDILLESKPIEYSIDFQNKIRDEW
ncbi:MAG: AbrB/MazE/SpoVT family DNA-binding domain-containing protein [Candidatus Helarchaeota archaeon]